MASTIVFNSVSYSVAAEGDSNWGPDLSLYLIAIASHSLQKSAGNFTLTAEANFGATYGLKSAYYKSQATNPASTGILRLGNAENISWRNAANNADLALTVNASNLLQFNGSSILLPGIGSIVNADVNASAAIAYSKLNLATSIVNADISASAAIAYSKLSLTNSILNADIGAAAAIAYSKLNLSTSIVNADINAAAAIAYSKLNLGTSIVNADISASAAIALSKLAATTVSRALVSDASGVISPATTTSTEIGYVNGVTSAIQTQLDGKIAKSTFTTKGDLPITTAASTVTRLPVSGTDGFVLTEDSASAGGLKWAAAPAAPSTSYEMSNLGLATSVAANALTIALKQADGATNPGAGASAVKIGMPSSTLTSGAYNQRSATAATSLVISSGSTLGQISTLPARLWIYLIDNAGALELAVSQTLYPESNKVMTTTAEGGAGAADSASAIYSTTARVGVPFRVVGFLDNTQTTAGTWASAGTKLFINSFGAINSETVAFMAEGASSSALGSNTTIPFNAPAHDTHSGWNSTNKDYVVPFTGYYKVTCAARATFAGATVNQYFDTIIQVDNVTKREFVKYLENTGVAALSGITSYQTLLTAGQKIRGVADTNLAAGTLTTGATHTYLEILRIK